MKLKYKSRALSVLNYTCRSVANNTSPYLTNPKGKFGALDRNVHILFGGQWILMRRSIWNAISHPELNGISEIRVNIRQNLYAIML